MSAIFIRRTWETNSSSSHSLVLVDLDKAPPLTPAGTFGPVVDGELIVNPVQREFGWQWEVWEDPATKIMYLLLDGFDRNRLQAILDNRLVGQDGVVRVKLPEGDSSATGDAYSYIDHESVGTSAELRDKTDDQVWAFLVGPSVIQGGNDNDQNGPWVTDRERRDNRQAEEAVWDSPGDA